MTSDNSCFSVGAELSAVENIDMRQTSKLLYLLMVRLIDRIAEQNFKKVPESVVNQRPAICFTAQNRPNNEYEIPESKAFFKI